MANLKVVGVDKLYPSGSLALYDVNLEARDKEFLVILGGEASGKSTLLRVIAGLEQPSDGLIEISGKDMTETDPKDRDIAMVFKSSTLYPALTVFDNMAFGLRLRKASPALVEQRVKSAANVLGLTDVLYRKPKTLSAIQKQRVAIGRAIVREPKIYLLDEPLAGLDAKLQSELLNVIINLQARMEGTFVYATKNVAEAMTIGTRIAVLKNGILQQVDLPENLYDYPANAYVAFYIGLPTINFINKAKIIKTEEGYSVAEGELKIPLGENIVKRFENIGEYADCDKPVIAGIRPEDAVAGGDGTNGVITKIESDGDKRFAEFKLFSHDLVVTAEEGASAGEAKVKINPDRIYLFDGETRLTLLSRDGGYIKTDFADAEYKPFTFKEEDEIKDKFKEKKSVKKKK